MVMRYAIVATCPATGYRSPCSRACAAVCRALPEPRADLPEPVECAPAPCCLLPNEHPVRRVAMQRHFKEGYPGC